MKILKTLHEERRSDTYFEMSDKALNNLRRTSVEKVGYIFGWIKPGRWDKIQSNRELYGIDFSSAKLFFRRTDENCKDFRITATDCHLSDASRDRNLPVLIRTSKIKKYLEEINENLEIEKAKKLFGNHFYCLRLVRNGLLIVWDFVQNKKTIFNDWEAVSGWYYNPRFDKDKVLEWFDTGFASKYSKRCSRCGRGEVIAYQESDVKLTRVGDSDYCDRCLQELNYGVCDATKKIGFRIKLKFSCKKDKKAVLKALKISKKKEINVLSDVLTEKNIKRCDNCDCHYIGEDNYCSECKYTRINSYSDKRYRFLRTSNEADEKMFFGTECEIEVNGSLDKCSKILNKNLEDMVYLKSDGSISHGFEIVSYAMTYKKWYSSLKRFKKIYQQVINKGGYSESATTTGLHIHISRAGFKDKNHLARFARCFYVDKDLTKEVACREFNHYAQWNDYRAEREDYFEYALDNLNTTFDDRYHIVNFRNEKTVEIRMFNGTLRADVIFAYIQFCKLLVDYTKINNVVKKDTMIAYLKRNAKSRVLRNILKMYDFKKKFSLKEAVCA